MTSQMVQYDVMKFERLGTIARNIVLSNERLLLIQGQIIADMFHSYTLLPPAPEGWGR